MRLAGMQAALEEQRREAGERLAEACRSSPRHHVRRLVESYGKPEQLHMIFPSPRRPHGPKPERPTTRPLRTVLLWQ